MAEESRMKKGGIIVPKPSPSDHHGGKDERRQAKITIKSADMKEEMQKEAVERALAAFERHSVEKDVAAYIKKGVRQNLKKENASYVMDNMDPLLKGTLHDEIRKSLNLATKFNKLEGALLNHKA